jgi:tetratricopeptide (TPR) repeat protein
MNAQTLRILLRLATVVALLALASGCSREGRKAGLIKKADAYFTAGEFDKAEIEYKNVIQTAGLDPHAIGRLGVIYLEQGRGARAYSYLLKANELDPANLEIRNTLGYLYAGGGKPNEARDAALFVLEKRPGDTDAPLILAEIALQPRDVIEARARLQSLPPTAAILSALAVLELRERKLPEAQALLTRALEMDPKSTAALSGLARIHWARNEIDQADKRFAETVAVAPPRSQFRLQYARFKIQNGKADEAKALLDESIAKTPDYIPAYLMRATIATSEKKHEESVALYDKVLALDPEHPEALLMSGQERLALGANEKAVATLEKAVATFPGSGQAHFQLGTAYLTSGDLARAAASLSEAIRLLPPGTPAPLVTLARVQLRQGNYGPAVDALKPFVEKNPTHTEAKLLLAEGYQKQGNYDGALAIYRPLIEATPQSAQLHFLIGGLFLQQGKRAEARQAFTKVSELAPTFLPAVEQLVNLDVAEKQFDAAKAKLRAFATANPKEAAPHLINAQINLIQNDRQAAETNLLKAIELRPDITAPYNVLAQLQINSNRVPEAMATLKRAIAQNARDADAYLWLGIVQDQQKDYPAARASYEKALEIAPKAWSAMNNLAYLLSERLGDQVKALELAQRARELEPGNPAVADTLGWILYKTKQYGRAVTVLDESSAKLPKSGEARYHAGMAHYMSGNEAKARTALQEALALEATFSGHEDARQSLALLNLDIAKEGEVARAKIEQAIAQRADDPVALMRLAALHERGGKVDQAATAYEAVLKANPGNVNAALGLIRIHRSRNDAPKALELAKATRRVAPTDGALGHVLGRLAFEAGEHTFAVGVLQEASRRLETDPEAYFDLAEAAYSTGQIAVTETAVQDALQQSAGFTRATQARQFLEFVQAAADPAKSVALAGRAEGVLKANPNDVSALMVKATAARHQGDAKVARETYEKVLARYPLFTPAQRNLAILLSASPADAKRGLEFATKARTAFPSDAELAKAFGMMLYHDGNFTRASTLLQESARTRADDGEVQYYLGLAQRQLKNSTAGNKSLERAIELGLPANLATEARKALAEGKSAK